MVYSFIKLSAPCGQGLGLNHTRVLDPGIMSVDKYLLNSLNHLVVLLL